MSKTSPQDDNISRIPLLRSQVRALRQGAVEAGMAAKVAVPTDEAGHILTSNMLAGFALELGLKSFYLTFQGKAIRGHDLAALYNELPVQISGDIGATYAANLHERPPINSYAFRIAKQQPEPPGQPNNCNYDSADGLFASASRLFEQARYFFEQPQRGTWAYIHHPLHYMLVMSGVLDAVYEEYVRRGGWSPLRHEQ